MSQHNASLSAWSTASSQSAADELDELIDIEAGLTEILLQSRHEASVDDLDLMIDADSGLGAILGRRPDRRVANLAGAAATGVPQQENTPSIAAVQRLALRGTPEFASAIAVLRMARSLPETLSPDLKGVIELELSLVSLTGEILRQAHLAEERDRADTATGHDDFPSTTHPAEHAAALLAVLDHSLRGVLSLVDRLVDSPSGKPAITIAGPGTDISQIEGLRTDLCTLLHHLRLSNPALNLEQLQVPHFYIRSIGPAVMKFIRSALPPASGFPVKDDAVEDALGFFDDFTSADLTSADLTHADLERVRWSLAATNWPDGLDRDEMVRRSREISWGSGIYVVESGAAHRNFASQL
ncbi:hypothetical protein ACPCVO_36160 [Streptomyces umbrinus]|uniref:hypothetical protein n=1 Tax=Streptomyces umbrinus TaxID=67370 RepID=UPI003C2C25A3